MSTANRYIAVCDVLGFKSIIESKPLAVVVSDFQGLRKSAYDQTKFTVFHVDRHLGFKTVVEQVKFAIFSDTIMLWAEATDLAKIENFFDAVGRLISVSFLHDLPLRIGVAFGESFIDSENDIFLGQPIVDAYLTEQAQEWIGGACHKSCMNEENFLNVLKFEPKILMKYSIPLKEKSKEVLDIAIAWPTFESASTDDLLKRNIAQAASANVKTKHQNTLDFLVKF